MNQIEEILEKLAVEYADEQEYTYHRKDHDVIPIAKADLYRVIVELVNKVEADSFPEGSNNSIREFSELREQLGVLFGMADSSRPSETARPSHNQVDNSSEVVE